METRNSAAAQNIKKALVQANKNLKTLLDASIPIAMGTDTASPNDLGRWPGYFEHVEMEMMVQAGLTPMQVIVGAMVGGWLGRVLGFYRPGEAAGFVMAIVGAIVILALYRVVSGRSRV
jgi:imidazolonepropionase-like amidohydrolase